MTRIAQIFADNI